MHYSCNSQTIANKKISKMSLNLRAADKYRLTGWIPQVFTCESAEAFIEIRGANPNFTLADLAFLSDQTEEVWADILDSGAVYTVPPSAALKDHAIGGSVQKQECKIISDIYEPPVPSRSLMGEFESLLSVHGQKGIYERPKDNISPHRPSKTVLVKGTFTHNPRLKGPKGVQSSKLKQVHGHQRSHVFTNPSSHVLERPKISSQDMRYNALSQNYDRNRTGGNIGEATAKTPVRMRKIIFRKALNSADLLQQLCLKCIFQVKVGLKWKIIESKEDRAM